MNIMSWNCHFGLTNKKIDILINQKNVDIFVIQECRKQDKDLFSEEYFYIWYGDTTESKGDPNKTYGVGIFANKEKYNIEKSIWSDQLSNYRYIVPFNITDLKNNIKFVIVNVWTKSCDKNNNKYNNYHIPIFQAIKHHENFINMQNMIIMGDFNTGSVKQSESQKWYDDLKKKLLSYNFENCAKELELEPTYYKGNGNWLDDHCFIKKYFVQKYNLSIGSKDTWIGTNLSDHLPLFLSLQ